MRELRVRPGARYACFGDGVCCSDLHVVAPLGRTEVRRLRVLGAEVVWNPVLRAHAMATRDGACHQLGPDGCRVHADRPHVCRRFPMRLVATPTGLRVATEHRCPCRTMGERPALEGETARPWLLENRRLEPDLRVGSRVSIAGPRWLTFARYEAAEARMIERLLAGERPEEVVGASIPALEGVTLRDIGHQLRGRIDGTAGGDAQAWFGDALLVLGGDPERRSRGRPWAWAFDRAQARSPEAGDPEVILADFTADALWDLEWTQRGGLDRARSDLGLRLAVARWIAERLGREGARADRAAAEAVSIVELVGAAPLWPAIVRTFRAASA